MLVQKLRLQRGWSQEQLALLSGLSVRTIQRLERGQTASLESLKALAAVFEVDFSHLKEPDMSPSAPTIDRQPSSGGLTADEIFALSRVRRLRGFYFHLILFGVVFSALAAMSFTLERQHTWLLFTLVGWGSGLLFHALRAFDLVPFLTADWERAKVEQYLGRKLG